MSKKKASYVSKYWFARGYYHSMEDVDEPPSIEMCEYYIELTGVNVIEEYSLGKTTATADRVNGLA